MSLCMQQHTVKNWCGQKTVAKVAKWVYSSQLCEDIKPQGNSKVIFGVYGWSSHSVTLETNVHFNLYSVFDLKHLQTSNKLTYNLTCSRFSVSQVQVLKYI